MGVGGGGRIPRLICTQFLIDQNRDGHEFEVQTREWILQSAEPLTIMTVTNHL